ncbi:MAG: hypothetical protein EP344_12400 [Bacteroidetes bacterium]|nr:MAG: hypothetical protein EP344_12400 [Bacteroidota bacterium]
MTGATPAFFRTSGKWNSRVGYCIWNKPKNATSPYFRLPMRQSFANLLAAPLVAGALVFLYLAWTKDSYLAPWIIPFIVGAAFIYVFSPQINWWYYSRRPPALSAPLRGMLEQFCVFYRNLDAGGKQRFRNRTALFIMGTDWEPVAWPDDSLPPDVQLAIAAQAVTLHFNQPKILFDKFEKVIVYPYPFPSPEYDFAHTSELYEPDGCLLFSAEQLMQAFVQPTEMYNIGMHEYAKAFILSNPKKDFPQLDPETIWTSLHTISHMPRTHVESVIGIPDIEPLPVVIHHYFIFPKPFRKILPDVASALDSIFQPSNPPTI